MRAHEPTDPRPRTHMPTATVTDLNLSTCMRLVNVSYTQLLHGGLAVRVYHYYTGSGKQMYITMTVYLYDL